MIAELHQSDADRCHHRAGPEESGTRVIKCPRRATTSAAPNQSIARTVAQLRAINERGRSVGLQSAARLRPSFFRAIWQAFRHPRRGYRLSESQRELIATYVNELARSSQDWARRTWGVPIVSCVDDAASSVEERAVLAFVRSLIHDDYQIADDDVHALREAGWSDVQIAEAAYDVAIYALNARIAQSLGAGEAFN